jgi:RNA polymerase sigma factor (sigma-70 family)
MALKTEREAMPKDCRIPAVIRSLAAAGASRCRAPPLRSGFQNPGFQIGEKDMNDNARCFVLAGDGYEEIPYIELQKRRTSDPAYAGKRFIPLHGMLMEVTEADYRDFYRSIERQKYLRKEAKRTGEVSYDALDTDEMSGEDTIPNTSPPPDDVVSDWLLLEEMLCCFRRLDESDRKLLAALYFEDKGERTLAAELGITHQAVNKRRQKAIAKLRELMGL